MKTILKGFQFRTIPSEYFTHRWSIDTHKVPQVHFIDKQSLQVQESAETFFQVLEFETWVEFVG